MLPTKPHYAPLRSTAGLTLIARSIGMEKSMTTRPSLPTHPFWSFSCQLYEQAKQPLLALQNRRQVNINVLLFCCWVTASDQGSLNKQDLKKLLSTIYLWHERIVLPLRELRRQLKKNPRTTEHGSFISDTINIEITAEQIEQLIMTDLMLKKSQHLRKNPSQRVTQICQHIDSYCQLIHVYLDEADCTDFSQVLSILYPELDFNKISSICHTIFLAKKKNKMPIKKQLHLEFS